MIVLIVIKSNVLPSQEDVFLINQSKLIIEDWTKPFYTEIIVVSAEKADPNDDMNEVMYHAAECPSGYEVIFQQEWPGMGKACDCSTNQMI